MARDYKRENEKRNEKKARILADIDKGLANELREKLKQDGKSIASWITENAKKYLKKG